MSDTRLHMIERLLLSLTVLFVASMASADWEVVSTLDETSGAERKVATVTSEDGHTLTVSPMTGNAARCALQLADGSPDTFTPEHPPTLQVDGGPTTRIVSWPPEADPYDDGGDFMEAARRRLRGSPGVSMNERSVVFQCWKGLARQSSPTWGPVRQMMDGEHLTVDFQPAEGGRASFDIPLSGASEAISETLGITSQPSERDWLQDDLLRFRVEYRGNTCFLLAGKKNLKRCLEAVNRCAGQSHDSVIDNLGCIEVE